MITNREQLQGLDGAWKATSETYNLAKQLKYPPESIKIILHKDSTFEAINIPDCLSDGLGNPVAHRLLHATGKWKVEKIGKDWKIRMEFKRGKLFTKGMSTDFDVYLFHQSLLMGVYAGIPTKREH